jgi:CDP-diacylglycerol--glycerol-3-phosphate 3-phosphatidyltransferase
MKTDQRSVAWLMPSFWRTQIRAVSARSLGPLVELLGKAHITPNAITAIGFLGAVGAGVALGYGKFLLGGAITLAAGLFDMLDGLLARRLGKGTTFGAFLDSVTDRLSEVAIALGLLVFFADNGQKTEILLTYLAIVSAFLVSYLRARAEGLGLKGEVGILTRGERVVILAIGLMVDQVTIALWIITVLGFVTVLQRFLMTWQQTRSSGR